MDDSKIEQSFLGGRVTVIVGNITQQSVDAIVNAANSTLLGGGGVDGAIHRAGGSQILEECKEIRRSRYPEGLPTGEAVITSGGNLPASYVIHTMGPIKGAEGGARCRVASWLLLEFAGLSSTAQPEQRRFPINFDGGIPVPTRGSCCRVVKGH